MHKVRVRVNQAPTILSSVCPVTQRQHGAAIDWVFPVIFTARNPPRRLDRANCSKMSRLTTKNDHNITGFANPTTGCFLNALAAVWWNSGTCSNGRLKLSQTGRSLEEVLQGKYADPKNAWINRAGTESILRMIYGSNMEQATLHEDRNTQRCPTEVLDLIMRYSELSHELDELFGKPVALNSMLSWFRDASGELGAQAYHLCHWHAVRNASSLFVSVLLQAAEMNVRTVHFGDMPHFWIPPIDDQMKAKRDFDIPLPSIVKVVAKTEDNEILHILYYRLVGAVETVVNDRVTGHHIGWFQRKMGWYSVDDGSAPQHRLRPSSSFSLVVYDRVHRDIQVRSPNIEEVSLIVPSSTFEIFEKTLREHRPISETDVEFQLEQLTEPLEHANSVISDSEIAVNHVESSNQGLLSDAVRPATDGCDSMNVEERNVNQKGKPSKKKTVRPKKRQPLSEPDKPTSPSTSPILGARDSASTQGDSTLEGLRNHVVESHRNPETDSRPNAERLIRTQVQNELDVKIRHAPDKTDIVSLTSDDDNSGSSYIQVEGVFLSGCEALDSAKPGQHINDNILEIGMRQEMSILARTGKNDRVQLLDSWILDGLSREIEPGSPALDDIAIESQDVLRKAYRAYANCAHWQGKCKMDLFEMDFLIFPVHLNLKEHWSVAFVQFTKPPKNGRIPHATIFLSDSLHGIHEHSYVAKLVRFFLNHAWNDKIRQDAADSSTTKAERDTEVTKLKPVPVIFAPQNCPEVILSTPQQKDLYNCGIYSILAVRHFALSFCKDAAKGKVPTVALESHFKSWRMADGEADDYRKNLLEQLKRVINEYTKCPNTAAPSVNRKGTCDEASASAKISSSTPGGFDGISGVDKQEHINSECEPPEAGSEMDISDNRMDSECRSDAASDAMSIDGEHPGEMKHVTKDQTSSLNGNMHEPTQSKYVDDRSWLPLELTKMHYPPSPEPPKGMTECHIFHILAESIESLPHEAFLECINRLLREYRDWFVALKDKLNAREIGRMICVAYSTKVENSGRTWAKLTKHGHVFKEEQGWFPLRFYCSSRDFPEQKRVGERNQRNRMSKKCGCKATLKIGFDGLDISKAQHVCETCPPREDDPTSYYFQMFKNATSANEAKAFERHMLYMIETFGDNYDILSRTIKEKYKWATAPLIHKFVRKTRMAFRGRETPEALHAALAEHIEKLGAFGEMMYTQTPDKSTSLLTAAFWMLPEWPSPSEFHMFFLDGTSKAIGHDMVVIWIMGLSQVYELETVGVLLSFSEKSEYLSMALTRMEIRDPTLFQRSTVWMSDEGSGIVAALKAKAMAIHLKCAVHKRANFFKAMSAIRPRLVSDHHQMETNEFWRKVDDAKEKLERLGFKHDVLGGPEFDYKNTDEKRIFAEWGNVFPEPTRGGKKKDATVLQEFLYLRSSWCYEVFLARLGDFAKGSDARLRHAIAAARNCPDWALCCRRLAMDLGYGTSNPMEGKISSMKKALAGHNLSAPKWFEKFNEYAAQSHLNARDLFVTKRFKTLVYMKGDLQVFKVMIDHLENVYVTDAGQVRLLREAQRSRGASVQQISTLDDGDIRCACVYSFFGICFVYLSYLVGVRKLDHRLFRVECPHPRGANRPRLRFFVLILSQGSYVCSCGYTIQNGGLFCRHVFAVWEDGHMYFHARLNLHPFFLTNASRTRPDYSKPPTSAYDMIYPSIANPHKPKHGAIMVLQHATWNPLEQFDEFRDRRFWPCCLTYIAHLLLDAHKRPHGSVDHISNQRNQPTLKEEASTAPSYEDRITNVMDFQSNAEADTFPGSPSESDSDSASTESDDETGFLSRGSMNRTRGAKAQQMHNNSFVYEKATERNTVRGSNLRVANDGKMPELDISSIQTQSVEDLKKLYIALGEKINRLESQSKRAKLEPGEASNKSDAQRSMESPNAPRSTTRLKRETLDHFDSVVKALDHERLLDLGRAMQSKIIGGKPLHGPVTAKRLGKIVAQMSTSQLDALGSLLEEHQLLPDNPVASARLSLNASQNVTPTQGKRKWDVDDVRDFILGACAREDNKTVLRQLSDHMACVMGCAPLSQCNSNNVRKQLMRFSKMPNFKDFLDQDFERFFGLCESHDGEPIKVVSEKTRQQKAAEQHSFHSPIQYRIPPQQQGQ